MRHLRNHRPVPAHHLHHLKVLRSAGLLESQRRGTWVYYRVIPAALQQLSAILQIESGPTTPSDACTEEVTR